MKTDCFAVHDGRGGLELVYSYLKSTWVIVNVILFTKRAEKVDRI